MTFSQTLLEHVSGLTDSMRTLKDRVRDAVTQELSRIVGQTVQDVLDLVLRRREPQLPPVNQWVDDDEEEYSSAVIHPQPVTRPWTGWLLAASHLFTWWLARPIRSWWPLVAIAGVSLATYSQQPILLATMAAVQTATELLAP